MNSYMNEYMKRRYHERKSLGLCRHCLEPVLRSSMCESHYTKWREKHFVRKAAYDKAWRQKQRTDALARYGNKCSHCGGEGVEFHHTNLDGSSDRATRAGKNGGAHLINRRIARDGRQEGIELLCISCHHAVH